MDIIVNKITLLVLTIIISITCISQAEQHTGSYSVQIAAYKYLPDNFIKSAEKYGSVHTSHLGELTRVSVGNFENKNAALELLLQLKKAGYDDAFINHISSSMISNRSQISPQPYQHENHASPSSEMTKFRNLSEAEKERAVFIDGKLHLKQGNRFMLIP